MRFPIFTFRPPYSPLLLKGSSIFFFILCIILLQKYVKMQSKIQEILFFHKYKKRKSFQKQEVVFYDLNLLFLVFCITGWGEVNNPGCSSDNDDEVLVADELAVVKKLLLYFLYFNGFFWPLGLLKKSKKTN